MLYYGILEEACAMILLIDTLRLSERFIENQKSVLESKIPYFKKWKTKTQNSVSSWCVEEENESDHFEPIRMRLMADEMFQLTFQIENLDQILENPRVYNRCNRKFISIKAGVTDRIEMTIYGS